MFDLTKEITLTPQDKKLYQKLQIALYLIALLSALYLSYLIIFPHKLYTFSFLNPSSNKNNISTPHLTNGDDFENGQLSGGNVFYFDTNLEGDYSYATVSLYTANSTKNLGTLDISVRKSYQAFMYNLGSPIGFHEGSLLENSGNYYIISDSAWRKFSDINALSALGYSEKNFHPVTVNEMVYNPIGKDITANDSYPDGTLFRIADNYYILNNQQLEKFVSDQAYLTQYDANIAITKDASFLKNYPITDNLAGFADGTLVANGGSVFIVSDGKILPIDNPQTFAQKGYNWNNVLNVGEDEIAIYQRDKLFNIKSIHPDGTIFKTSENSMYYIIEKGEKHLLPGTDIAASWLKKGPIEVSEKALSLYADCSLKNNFWQSSVYSCRVPLNSLSDLIGFDYEFKLKSATNLHIDSLSVDYKKDITQSNFKSFFHGLYNSIISTYASSTPTS